MYIGSRIGLWLMVLGQAELKGKQNVKMFSFVHIGSSYIHMCTLNLSVCWVVRAYSLGRRQHTYIDNVGF